MQEESRELAHVLHLENYEYLHRAHKTANEESPDGGIEVESEGFGSRCRRRQLWTRHPGKEG